MWRSSNPIFSRSADHRATVAPRSPAGSMLASKAGRWSKSTNSPERPPRRASVGTGDIPSSFRRARLAAPPGHAFSVGRGCPRSADGRGARRFGQGPAGSLRPHDALPAGLRVGIGHHLRPVFAHPVLGRFLWRGGTPGNQRIEHLCQNIRTETESVRREALLKPGFDRRPQPAVIALPSFFVDLREPCEDLRRRAFLGLGFGPA